MPRRKTITHTNRITGQTIEVQIETPADASVEQRFSEMLEAGFKAVEGDIERMVMHVKCDGCGLTVDVKRPELPDGWITRLGGEFCQRCQ